MNTSILQQIRIGTPIGPLNIVNPQLKPKNIIEFHKTTKNNPKIDL